MKICKKCGMEYSGFLTKGFCNECFTAYNLAKAEEEEKTNIEKKQKEDEEARTYLPLLAKKLAPEKTFDILGVVFWTRPKNLASSGMGKLIFGGFVDYAHTFGIIGVTDRELFIFEFGEIVGDKITVADIKRGEKTLKSSIKQVNINEITATYGEKYAKAILSISGALKIKVKFPHYYETENIAKAVKIYELINSS